MCGLCGLPDRRGLCWLPDRSGFCKLPDRSGLCGLPDRIGLWSGLCGLLDWSGLCGLPDRSGLWSGLCGLLDRSRLCGLPDQSGLWSGLCGITDWSGLHSYLHPEGWAAQIQSQIDVVLQRLLLDPVGHPWSEGLGHASLEDDHEAGLFHSRLASHLHEVPGIILNFPVSLADIEKLPCWTHSCCWNSVTVRWEKAQRNNRVWVQMQENTLINNKKGQQDKKNKAGRRLGHRKWHTVHVSPAWQNTHIHNFKRQSSGSEVYK